MNVIDFLNQHGVQYRRAGETQHVTRGWIGLVCPFCGAGSGNYGMGINLTRLNCSCWKCGPCRLADLLNEVTSLPIKDLIQIVKGLDKVHETGRIQVKGKLTLPKDVGPMRKAHRDYLKRRGFVPSEIAKLWGVGGIGPMGGRLAWRLFIPIHYRGEIVSWTTRSINEKAKMRYVAAAPDQEKINHKRLLYGEDYCRNSVVVCEGPTDVWRIGPGAVCTFGTGFRAAQVRLLSAYPVRAVCYDNEVQAQEQAESLVSSLEVFDGDTYKVRLVAKDPGSAGRDEVERIRVLFFGDSDDGPGIVQIRPANAFSRPGGYSGRRGRDRRSTGR